MGTVFGFMRPKGLSPFFNLILMENRILNNHVLKPLKKNNDINYPGQQNYVGWIINHLC